jgi:NAD(P)-dependent dehydrogenase (short-subunit alcohol dehydrogenase family)
MAKRVMLISGGFGGLGTVLGRAAAGSGYQVALVGRSAAPDGDFDALRLGGIATGTSAGAAAASSAVLAKLGRLDVLVNATGDFSVGSVADGEVEEWVRLYAASVVPAVAMSKAAIPALVTSGAGRIVNVAWTGAREGKAFLGAASAAKAGVLRLTEALADELKDSGVTANAVLPTIIDTPFNRQVMPEADRSTWVSYEQVVTAILFLASSEASATNGNALIVAPKG